jgi:hypothetical protein
MTNELEEVDFILSGMEDYLHGEDGDKISNARHLIIKTISEYSLIKKELEGILNRMSNCVIDAWRGDLDDTIEAFCVEDYCGDPDEPNEVTVPYNGWYEDLLNLKDKL